MTANMTGVQRSPLPWMMLLALAAVVVATVVGLVEYRPRDRTVEQAPGAVQPRTLAAEVDEVRRVPCRVPGRRDCSRVTATLKEGRRAGRRVSFTAGETSAEVRLSVGDDVRLYRNPIPPGAAVGDEYVLSDFERRAPLLWLALIFAVLVVATGRLQGVRALLGLVASLGVVLLFVVPAILDGQSAIGVALFGALAIMLLTIPLAHGLGPKTLAACLGTTVSLALTLTLAKTFGELAHLTGLSSEEAVFLRATAGDAISIQGLLLAGMVIGALGVLDDLTVSQASTVMALRRANTELGFRQLFRRALGVGHDHIAATVNTLVLAYAGAALPVLLIFNLGDTRFGDAVNNEAVAEEIVAMLVGSIGLVVAVPVTTALAALLATTVPERMLGGHGHAH
jgi:uncharacterized membrane protein